MKEIDTYTQRRLPPTGCVDGKRNKMTENRTEEKQKEKTKKKSQQIKNAQQYMDV